MSNTLDKLRELCKSTGWDGYNSSSISDVVFSRAERIQMVLPNDWELFPTGRNSVQYEVDSMTDKCSCYEEVEIFEDRVVYFTKIIYNDVHVDNEKLIDERTVCTELVFSNIDNAIKYFEKTFKNKSE